MPDTSSAAAHTSPLDGRECYCPVVHGTGTICGAKVEPDATDAAEMMAELGRQDIEIEDAIDRSESASPRRQSSMFLASELVRSLMEPAEFWEAFKSVKYDSGDGDGYEGEQIIVIVAKGESAERISEAYEGLTDV